MSDENTQSSECVTKKMTPVECLKMGVAVDKAKAMALAELTKEDAEYLLQHGISKHGLSKLYKTNDGSIYPRLTKWGLHKPSAAMTANQRLDAFKKDKPVLAPLPDTIIPCACCMAHFKRVELVMVPGIGYMCGDCYDEMKKPEAVAINTVGSEDIDAKKISDVIAKAINPQEPEEIKPVEKPNDSLAMKSSIYTLSRPIQCFSGPEPGELKDSGERTAFNTGAVRDMHEGKGRYDLLPWDAIHELAVHCEEGAKKYGERNCEKGIPIHSLVDSAVRHLSCYLRGQDDEPHLRAAVWNICFAIYMEKNLPGMQDIPARLAVIRGAGINK